MTRLPPLRGCPAAGFALGAVAVGTAGVHALSAPAAIAPPASASAPRNSVLRVSWLSMLAFGTVPPPGQMLANDAPQQTQRVLASDLVNCRVRISARDEAAHDVEAVGG